MIFAYMRVSTEEQKKKQGTERQDIAIKEYAENHGITIDRTYEDTASGRNFDRPQYQALKMNLRPGDTLIIKELDRFGRNMDDIKTEWKHYTDNGIDIIIIDNEMLSTNNKSDLDKKVITNIMLELLSYLAEKERIKIKARQAEGIEIAKKAGKYTGRKRIENENFEEVYDRWSKGEIKDHQAVAELGNMNLRTFYRRVKERRTTT